MRGGLLAWLVVALMLASCDQMADQPRNKPGAARAGAASAMPAGTVARDDVAATVPPLTPALLARGRERFDIACSPCHGRDGYGDGMVVQRGFPHPPSFHDARLRDAPVQHFVDVIEHGYGAMYPYGGRVAAADRWAIAAYIRALQASQHSAVAELSDDARVQLP